MPGNVRPACATSLKLVGEAHVRVLRILRELSAKRLRCERAPIDFYKRRQACPKDRSLMIARVCVCVDERRLPTALQYAFC